VKNPACSWSSHSSRCGNVNVARRCTLCLPSSFGFIKFRTPDACQASILGTNGEILNGSRVRVDRAKVPSARPPWQRRSWDRRPYPSRDDGLSLLSQLLDDAGAHGQAQVTEVAVTITTVALLPRALTTEV
jgi:RNA recognition motif-containing protein